MQSKLIYDELLEKVKDYSDNDLKNIALKYLYLKFNISNADLLINKSITWSNKQENEFHNDINKMNDKIPVQHITGSEFFYDRISLDRNFDTKPCFLHNSFWIRNS